MKLNASMLLMLAVIAMAIGAATFRVTTAPDRIRLRLDTARTTCLNNGGEWVGVGRDAICQQPAVQKKS
jgi:hypothetical protein